LKVSAAILELIGTSRLHTRIRHAIDVESERTTRIDQLFKVGASRACIPKDVVRVYLVKPRLIADKRGPIDDDIVGISRDNTLDRNGGLLRLSLDHSAFCVLGIETPAISIVGANTHYNKFAHLEFEVIPKGHEGYLAGPEKNDLGICARAR
jgi:hypothetical protein